MRRPTALALVLAALICWPPTSAAAQDLESSQLALQVALGDLIDGVRDDPEGLKRLERVQEDINRLFAASSQIPADAREEYARTLEHDAQLLETAAASKAPAEREALLKSVQADLDAKLGKRSPLALGSKVRGQLELTVQTLRGGTQVSGYVVGLNPARWRGAAPMFRFQRLSSPTTRFAPPGRYEIVVLRGGAVIHREVADIGLAGEERLQIDVEMP